MAFAKEPRHSVLRPLVALFLAGERDLSATELFALRAYIVRFITSRQETVVRLAGRAPKLETREDFVQWFHEARFHDFDPVE
jgi:hypothetical protein